MAQYTASDQACAILTRVLESICRLNHKTLSPKTRADISRACELLSSGDDYDELLDDLLDQPPIRSDRTTVNLERDDYGDRRFGAWRYQREEDAR